jgi:hypothetical protein
VFLLCLFKDKKGLLPCDATFFMDLSACWMGDPFLHHWWHSGHIDSQPFYSFTLTGATPVSVASLRPTHMSLWSFMQFYPGGDHRPPAAAEQELSRARRLLFRRPEDQAGPRHHGKASHPRRALVQAAPTPGVPGPLFPAARAQSMDGETLFLLVHCMFLIMRVPTPLLPAARLRFEDGRRRHAIVIFPCRPL